MALTNERISSVTFVGRACVFGAFIQSVSETMEGITILACKEGVRIYKSGHDGYEIVYAAGIASARTRSEPRTDG